jgi:hypothetical protein
MMATAAVAARAIWAMTTMVQNAVKRCPSG